jgi:hypothetical protein
MLWLDSEAALLMRRMAALMGAIFALALAGCGEDGGAGSGEGLSSGASQQSGGCLSPAEVREEVDRIASGFESSDEEAEAKQQEIQAVEAEAC